MISKFHISHPQLGNNLMLHQCVSLWKATLIWCLVDTEMNQVNLLSSSNWEFLENGHVNLQIVLLERDFLCPARKCIVLFFWGGLRVMKITGTYTRGYYWVLEHTGLCSTKEIPILNTTGDAVGVPSVWQTGCPSALMGGVWRELSASFIFTLKGVFFFFPNENVLGGKGAGIIISFLSLLLASAGKFSLNKKHGQGWERPAWSLRQNLSCLRKPGVHRRDCKQISSPPKQAAPLCCTPGPSPGPQS